MLIFIVLDTCSRPANDVSNILFGFGHVFTRVPQSVQSRVAEVGSLSAMAKMAIKTIAKRVLAIFATNTTFLRLIANLEIKRNMKCNM